MFLRHQIDKSKRPKQLFSILCVLRTGSNGLVATDGLAPWISADAIDIFRSHYVHQRIIAVVFTTTTVPVDSLFELTELCEQGTPKCRSATFVLSSPSISCDVNVAEQVYRGLTRKDLNVLPNPSDERRHRVVRSRAKLMLQYQPFVSDIQALTLNPR